MTIQSPSWPPPAPRSGRDLRITVMTMAIAVLVVAGALVYVFGNTTPRSPRAHLESALLATNSAVSADLAVDFKVSFDGISVTVAGTGAVDFATKAATLHMRAFGQTFSFIETNGVIYMKFDKSLGTGIPAGKWVRMPVSAIGSSHDSQFLTYDPQQMIDAFVKLGATVTSIGTATIGGTTDQGYQVHLDLAELEAHASELPPTIRRIFGTTRMIPKTAQVTTKMYVDPAGQVQAAHVLVTAEENTHPITASFDLTMSHFGAATVPGPPPSTQTVTYQQLKGSLGSGALPFTSQGTQIT